MSSSPSAHRHDSGITARSRARILLVGDDPERCSAVATALRADGHSVVEVDAASEVFTQLAAGFLAGKRHGGFDLVLCDVRSIGAGARLLDQMRHAHLTTPAMLTERPLTAEHLRDAVDDVLRESSSEDEGDEREEPILEIVATLDDGLDAAAVESLLRAHGIHALLGSQRSLLRARGRTPTSSRTTPKRRERCSPSAAAETSQGFRRSATRS